MGARFADRIGKGIRGAPRDAMVADETPPEIRGRAFGLRQSLDTVGALLAPLVAIGLMVLVREQHPRRSIWIAVDPGRLLVPARLAGAAGARAASRVAQALAVLRGLPRTSTRETKRLLAVGFLFTPRPLFRSVPDPQGHRGRPQRSLSPLTLALFNLAYVALAYPAGALSDRMSPRTILMAGMAVLVAGNCVLAESRQLRRARSSGVALWGAHMALTQGIFSRMIADSAPDDLRATSFGAFWFVSGIGALLASLGAGCCGTARAAPRPSSPARRRRDGARDAEPASRGRPARA